MTDERDIAQQIGVALAPVVEAELKRRLARLDAIRRPAVEAARPKAAAPVRLPPTEVLEAAVELADAVDRLRDARFSSGELAARTAMERRAETLRSVVRRLGR